MRLAVAIAVLLYAAPARATWPTDVVVSEMRTWDGVRLDAPPTEEYAELVEQLGVAVVANPGGLPAATTGLAGFDAILQNTFGFIPAYADDDGPTGWQLAHPDGKPADWTSTPSLLIRKGLPWGLELGARGGWLGGSRQGVFGGFVRVAPLEGSQPLPDLAVQAGWSTYVGNPELDMGVLDLSATLGTRLRLVRIAGVTFSHWEPWFTFTMLRITATPRLDDATAADNGAFTIGGRDADEPALWRARYSIGFQVTTNKVLLRLASDWVPSAAPTLTVGLGFGI